MPVLSKWSALKASSQASEPYHWKTMRFFILGAIQSAQAMRFNVHRPERKECCDARGRQPRTVHNDALLLDAAGGRSWREIQELGNRATFGC
jgi:hypothetical protein